MLELFLKLVDRVIDLLRERASIDRVFFMDHVDPIFSDLRKIVDDYLGTLTEAKARLMDATTPVDETVAWLGERRHTLRRVRTEIQKYSDALVENDRRRLSTGAPSDDAANFAYAVYNVLTVEPTTVLPRPWQTAYTSLLEDLDHARILDPEGLRKFGVNAVGRYLNELTKRWDQAETFYYALRVKCLR
jgi:hypothetical protein